MPAPTNINEETFDHRIRQKPEIDYSNIPGAPGRRDLQVMRALADYGVRGRTCLDVGPGTGRWLHFLKDHGASRLAAVDLSQEVLDKVTPIGVHCQKADVEYQPLKFEANTFEITLVFMVLEHLRDPDLFIQEILRVTKQSGLVLMTIPNIASLQSRIRLLLGYLPLAVSQDHTHVRFYTMRELRQLFGARGAEVELIPTGFSLHPFNRQRLRVPSIKLLAGLDDHRLFRVRPGQ